MNRQKIMILGIAMMLLLLTMISVQGLAANQNLQASFFAEPVLYSNEYLFASFNLTSLGNGLYALKASGKFNKQSNYATSLILNNVCNTNGVGYWLTNRQIVFSFINGTSTDGSWSVDKTVNLGRFSANDLSHFRLAVNELSLTGAASSGAVNICI